MINYNNFLFVVVSFITTIHTVSIFTQRSIENQIPLVDCGKDTEKPVVAIDISKGGDFTKDDAWGSTLSCINTKHVVRLVDISSGGIPPCVVILIISAVDSNGCLTSVYTPKEVKLIYDAVNDDGLSLMILDSNSVAVVCPPNGVYPLTEAFGLKRDPVLSEGYPALTWNVSSPLFYGVNNIEQSFGVFYSTEGESGAVVYYTPTSAFMVAKQVGSGCLVVLGDALIASWYINKADNLRLLKNTFEYLDNCTCGNGKLSPSKECDDGNKIIGDGCSHCTIDIGFNCTGQPSVCSVLPLCNVEVNSDESGCECTWKLKKKCYKTKFGWFKSKVCYCPPECHCGTCNGHKSETIKKEVCSRSEFKCSKESKYWKTFWKKINKKKTICCSSECWTYKDIMYGNVKSHWTDTVIQWITARYNLYYAKARNRVSDSVTESMEEIESKISSDRICWAEKKELSKISTVLRKVNSHFSYPCRQKTKKNKKTSYSDTQYSSYTTNKKKAYPNKTQYSVYTEY